MVRRREMRVNERSSDPLGDGPVVLTVFAADEGVCLIVPDEFFVIRIEGQRGLQTCGDVGEMAQGGGIVADLDIGIGEFALAE